MNHVLLVLNGECQIGEYLRSRILNEYFIIGVDGGTRHLEKLNLTPELVVGDMDSVPDKLLARYSSENIEIHRYSPEKDKTDLELALDHLKQHPIQTLTVIGGSGGRLDHSLLVPQILIEQVSAHIGVTLLSNTGITQLVRKSMDLSLEKEDGELVSLIPLHDETYIRSFEGVRWRLKDELIKRGEGRTLSNEIVKSTATLKVGSPHGALLVHQQVLA